MHGKRVKTVLFGFVFFLGILGFAGSSWGWLLDYGCRKAITITESSGETLEDYQVLLEVSHVPGKMQDDFGDVRFAEADDVELDYWLESYVAAVSATFWVEVPLIPAGGSTTIYMYYDYVPGTVSTTSDGEATFLFFDDFKRPNSYIVGNGWVEVESSSTAEISSNTLQFTPRDDVKRPIVKKQLPPLPVRFRWKFSFDWARPEPEKNYYIYMQLGESVLMDDTQPGDESRPYDSTSSHYGTGVDLVWYKGANITHQVLSYYRDGSIQEDLITIWDGHSIEVLGNTYGGGSYDVYVDGILEKAGVAMNETATLDEMRFLAHGTNYERIAPRRFGDVLLANYASPPPGVSMGEEEEDSDGNGIEDGCETLVNPLIRAISGDPEAGLPNWDPASKIYMDVFHVENKSADQVINLPMAAVLEVLTPDTVSGVNTDNHAQSGGRPPDACWRYTEVDSEGTVGDLTDGTLDPGEGISRVLQFHDPTAEVFIFWANVIATCQTTRHVRDGGGDDTGVVGASGSGATGVQRVEPLGSGGKGLQYRDPIGMPDMGDGTISARIHDDGTAEIYVGSTSGNMIVANRFDISTPILLSSVSFYTSGAAAGDQAEVIVYEDAAGCGKAPGPSVEIARLPITLGCGGFQEIPLGDLQINSAGALHAAFFVALANTASRGCSLGVDLSRPGSGASYISIDGGLTYAPFSSTPVIDGSAMIRVKVREVGACFIEAAIRPYRPRLSGRPSTSNQEP